MIFLAAVIRRVAAVLLALGVVGLGLGAVARTAPAPQAAQAPDAPVERPAAKARDEAELPLGPPPGQVLARVNKDRLLIRVYAIYYEPVTSLRPDGNPVTSYFQKQKLVTRETALKDVKAHDVRGKAIARPALSKLLKKERPVLVSPDGRPVDPLHLRLVREGTVILLLPEATPLRVPVPLTPVPAAVPPAVPAPPLPVPAVPAPPPPPAVPANPTPDLPPPPVPQPQPPPALPAPPPPQPAAPSVGSDEGLPGGVTLNERNHVVHFVDSGTVPR